MKKLVGAALFVFWSLTTAIIIAGLVFYQDNKPANVPPPQPAISAGGVNNIGGVTLNMQEISRHNSANDCWMVIDNKVYNLTSYLGFHPGGNGVILPYCGNNGAQAFAGTGHSNYANNLLTSYLIGSLNQIISASQIQQNIQNTDQVAPSRNNYKGEDSD